MVHVRGRIGAAVAPLALAACLLQTTAAAAQGVGVQGGGSIDPEQGYVGAHAETPAFLGTLHFRPSVEGGFGDGFSLAAIDLLFVYRVPIPGSAWSFFQGGGPAVNIARVEFGPDDAEVDVGAGFVGIFGFRHANGFFAEVKAGARSSPGLKFGVGWTIR